MLITTQSDRPASARRAVAFCCDGNYLPYALFAASQIAALHPERGFDILLCDTAKLAIPDTLGRHGFRSVQIDTQSVFDGFGVDARRTSAMYLRLALPDALAQDYDRILYLDSDIFVQSGSLSSLLGANLHGHALGAVRDNIQWRTPSRIAPEFKTVGLSNAPYFNSGVLLVDVAEWQRQDILSRAVAIGRDHALMRHDQTLLNIVLHQNWAELSPVWNWQYSAQARLFEPMMDAHIIHFIGSRKPWKDPEGELPPRFAARLAAFLSEHLPGHPTIGTDRSPVLDTGLMRKMLVRHLMNLGKTQRYLSRFPTDTTTYPQERP
ncbi:glycosyltransferase family 8 protein [Flavimaricola marinus]|uniref:General stress protein A n=1 Tax=Flavimaricola marinus TaxID=1819565 RepID=A0A238LCB8_9RHOB|nr:glycosyltransferase family 8 protein [Flavimaricola marinus]SMY07222.1 General stress protein A [Flavimaricola marinus]